MPFSIVFLPFTATLMHQLTWHLAQIFFATCFTIYLYISCHFEVVLWLKWVHNVYSDTKKVSYLTVFTCLWLNPLTKWLENWHRCSLAHDPQYIFMTLVILRQFWDPYELTLSIPTKKSVVFDGFFQIVASPVHQMTWKLAQLYFGTRSTRFINDILRFEAVGRYFWAKNQFSRSKNGWPAYLQQVIVTSNMIQSQKFLGHFIDLFLNSNSL